MKKNMELIKDILFEGFYDTRAAGMVVDVLQRDYGAVLVHAQNVPEGEWSEQYSSEQVFLSGPDVGVFLRFKNKQLKGENIDNLQPDITTRMCEGIEMKVAADYHEKAREVVATISRTLDGHKASDPWVWGYKQHHTFFGSEEQMLRAYQEAHYAETRPEARPA